MFGGGRLTPSSTSVSLSSHLQPSLSSSRSTRVIEQLHEKLERIQKEVASTRSQLENAREMKKQCETQNKTYIESNKQYRIHIQSLMHVLETKQQQLDHTKTSSISMETQVKQLKDEALHSRQQLEALRKKEQVLAKERDMAVAKKEQWERQSIVLHSSLDQLNHRLEKEMGNLKQEWELIQLKVNQMKQQHDLHLNQVVLQMDQFVTHRQLQFHQLSSSQGQLVHQHQSWIDTVQHQLILLEEAIAQSGTVTDDFHRAANQCRGELNGLIMKIRAYTIGV
ncbi:unnamed protein product [Cunninghamella echinulata]